MTLGTSRSWSPVLLLPKELATLMSTEAWSIDPSVSKASLATFRGKIRSGKLSGFPENFRKILNARFRCSSCSLMDNWRRMNHSKDETRPETARKCHSFDFSRVAERSKASAEQSHF